MILAWQVLVCVCGVRPDHRREGTGSETETCIVRKVLGPRPPIGAQSEQTEGDGTRDGISGTHGGVACESLHIIGLKDALAPRSRALSEVE